MEENKIKHFVLKIASVCMMAVLSILLCGWPMGGIRTIYFYDTFTTDDFIEQKYFQDFQKYTTEIVCTIPDTDPVWYLASVDVPAGRITEERWEKDMLNELGYIEDPDNPGAYFIDSISFGNLNLHRIKLRLPYVGAWRCKHILWELKLSGIIEEMRWAPFVMGVIK